MFIIDWCHLFLDEEAFTFRCAHEDAHTRPDRCGSSRPEWFGSGLILGGFVVGRELASMPPPRFAQRLLNSMPKINRCALSLGENTRPSLEFMVLRGSNS